MSAALQATLLLGIISFSAQGRLFNLEDNRDSVGELEHLVELLKRDNADIITKLATNKDSDTYKNLLNVQNLNFVVKRHDDIIREAQENAENDANMSSYAREGPTLATLLYKIKGKDQSNKNNAVETKPLSPTEVKAELLTKVLRMCKRRPDCWKKTFVCTKKGCKKQVNKDDCGLCMRRSLATIADALRKTVGQVNDNLRCERRNRSYKDLTRARLRTSNHLDRFLNALRKSEDNEDSDIEDKVILENVNDILDTIEKLLSAVRNINNSEYERNLRYQDREQDADLRCGRGQDDRCGRGDRDDRDDRDLRCGRGQDDLRCGRGQDDLRCGCGRGQDNLRCGCGRGQDDLRIGRGTGDSDLRCGRDLVDLRCGCGSDDLRCGRGQDDLRCGRGQDDLRCGCGSSDLRCGRGQDDLRCGRGQDDLRCGCGSGDLRCGRGQDDLRCGRGQGDLRCGCGSDDLRCGRGQDDLRCGRGQDDLRYGRGQDNLRCGCGSDDLRCGRGQDDLRCGRGQDDLRCGRGQDDLRCGCGSGDLRCGRGQDDLRCGRGQDDLRCGCGSDDLRCGRGQDDLRCGRGQDDLRCGRGQDDLRCGRGQDDLRCGRGQDDFRYGCGSDDLRCGRGQDDLRCGRGQDDLRCGRGQGDSRCGCGSGDLRCGRGQDDLRCARGQDDLRCGRGQGDLRCGCGSGDLRCGRGQDDLRCARGQDDLRCGRGQDDLRCGRCRDDLRCGRGCGDLRCGGRGRDELRCGRLCDRDYQDYRDNGDLRCRCNYEISYKNRYISDVLEDVYKLLRKDDITMDSNAGKSTESNIRQHGDDIEDILDIFYRYMRVESRPSNKDDDRYNNKEKGDNTDIIRLLNIIVDKLQSQGDNLKEKTDYLGKYKKHYFGLDEASEERESSDKKNYREEKDVIVDLMDEAGLFDDDTKEYQGKVGEKDRNEESNEFDKVLQKLNDRDDDEAQNNLGHKQKLNDVYQVLNQFNNNKKDDGNAAVVFDLRVPGLFPPTKKQRILMNSMVQEESSFSRRSGPKVEHYGIPFEMEVQGLGQVNP